MNLVETTAFTPRFRLTLEAVNSVLERQDHLHATRLSEQFRRRVAYSGRAINTERTVTILIPGLFPKHPDNLHRYQFRENALLQMQIVGSLGLVGLIDKRWRTFLTDLGHITLPEGSPQEEMDRMIERNPAASFRMECMNLGRVDTRVSNLSGVVYFGRAEQPHILVQMAFPLSSAMNLDNKMHRLLADGVTTPYLSLVVPQSEFSRKLNL